MRNTIAAGNISALGGDDVHGNLTSDGYNLIGDTEGANITGTATGNQYNLDAKLGPLQDNGGPTRTHALLSGSPAIESGDSGGTNVDQRGLVRPVDSPVLVNVGDGADIGAYEGQADQLFGCSDIDRVVRNNNDSGAGSLRAVLANVCGGSTITFAENVRGAIDLTTGQLTINKGLQIEGPGANLLSVQRSSAAVTPNFRIFNIAGNLQVAISGLTIANGVVQGGVGGGILNPSGSLLLNRVVIFGNYSDQGGGGLANNGVATISHSTISVNTAPGGGGMSGLGSYSIRESTISGNRALTGFASGGGILVNGGTVVITNSTLAGNSAGDTGGGIYNQGFLAGTVRTRNTIIALNSANSAPDFAGTLISNGFNLIGNNSGATVSSVQFTDQIGTPASPLNPLLGPLQDNGGPTFTRALLAGSTALDRGNSTGSITDQRYSPRPVGSANVPGGDGSDIGAFEFSPAPTPTPTPTATPTATPVPGSLANISTRLRVETGDNVLIAGIIVTGNAPKKIMIRAIGPSLPLADKLANPTLELRDGTGALLEANDDWMNSANKQAIIDSTIPPTNDLEAAIVRSVPAGAASYTAVVRGVNNETGLGVVEVYDLDTAADSTIANISTRGFVLTGDNVLIAGTIVAGQVSQRVIIRAIGPSLAISGAMANPILELRDSSGTLLQANDNWVDSADAQAIIDTTIPPSNNLESAIVATLPANNASYTAIVRGVNDTTGIAVVEVYALEN